MDGWASTFSSFQAKAKELAATVQESTAKSVDWQGVAAKAREVTTQLQENTSKVATQLQESSKVLAERATEVSTATAETAKAKLKDLGVNDSLVTLEEKLNDLNSKINKDAQPEAVSDGELTAFGITPDFQDFVRSLNYSTFRDFPDEHLQPLDDGGDAPGSSSRQLSPWQARHAVLVVQSVKEINELRFVLCPRRMDDERFWAIYFSLAKKHLPRRAYDPSAPLPEVQPAAAGAGGSGGDGTAPADSAKATLESLKTTFSGFGINLRSWASTGVPTLGGGAAAGSNPGSSGNLAAAGGGSEGGEGGSGGGGSGAERAAPSRHILEADPDLEEFLKVAAEGGDGGSDTGGTPSAGGLSGSTPGSAKGDGDGDGGSEVDLDHYLQELSAASDDEGEDDDDLDATLADLAAGLSDSDDDGGEGGAAEADDDLEDALAGLMGSDDDE